MKAPPQLNKLHRLRIWSLLRVAIPLAIGLLLQAPPAFAQLSWRVSVKFILDANGNRPPATITNANGNVRANAIATDDQVHQYIEYGNRVLRRSGRGYQMLLTEITEVVGASRWFNIDATGDGDDLDSKSDGAELERAIKQSLAQGSNSYKFRTNAINIYIVGSATQGECVCGGQGSDSDILILSQNINPDWVILHESAHYLSLKHTHTGQQEARDVPRCSDRLPGDDGIPDTLPDNSCWSFNQLAEFHPMASGNELTNTFFNIMAKHGSTPGFRYILTPDQLDAMTDSSNKRRRQVTTGRTVFVGPTLPAIMATGDSDAPYATTAIGILNADPGDIVLLRSKTYVESGLYTKAITLRASRGDATIRAQ